MRDKLSMDKLSIEEILRKILIEKYKYTVVIAVSYYILPFLIYLIPVDDPFDRMTLFALAVIAVIPFILLVLSIIFAMDNGFHWYFSFRVFILCLAYMIFTGAGIFIYCGILFIISLTGQSIGAFIRTHKW